MLYPVVGSKYYKCVKTSGVEVGPSGAVGYGRSTGGDLTLLLHFFIKPG